MNAKKYYNVLKNGSIEDKKRLYLEMPKTDLKSSAKTLLPYFNEPMYVFTAFRNLTIPYCEGVNFEIGKELSKALFDYSKELFNDKVPHLMFSTIVDFASSHTKALNHLGAYEETVKFIDDNEDLLFKYTYADKAKFHEKDAYYKWQISLQVHRVQALINLNKIDEADKFLGKIPENISWSMDIEIKRLKRTIENLKKEPTKVKDDPNLQSTEDTRKESYGDIVETLQKMAQNTGFIDPKVFDSLLDRSKQENLNTKEGFQSLLQTLNMGEALLTKRADNENELAIRKRIRDASSIFVHNQPNEHEIKKSLEDLKIAYDWTQKNKSQELENDALWGMYLCYSRLKNYSNAANQLIKLRRNLEELRKSINEPQKRGGAFSTYVHLFDALGFSLSKTQRTAELLDAIEGAKSRVIADSILEASGKEKVPFKLENVAQQLIPLLKKENTHYISYLVDSDNTYAVLATKDGHLYQHTISIGEEQFRDWLEYDLEQPKNWRRVSEDVGINLMEELIPLVDWLQPYFDEGILEEGDHICYCPHSYLYQFPLHYIRFNRKPLIQNFTLSRTHSVFSLIELLSKDKFYPNKFERFCVHSQEDSKSTLIQEWFGKSGSILKELLNGKTREGLEGSLENILENFELRYKIIHFSTHGIFKKDAHKKHYNPYSTSGLLLPFHNNIPNFESSEFLLSPKKIIEANTRFDKSHISLQACVSGYSREGIAGDALGLEYAFFLQGASSLISTHWDIDLSYAVPFCNKFYDYWLNKGWTKAKSHQQACLDMLALDIPEKNPKEYYWASFSLSGDWR